MNKPYDNYLLFKPFKTNGLSSAGLLIPDSCQKESCKGEIVEVGDGTQDTPMQFKKGQIVWRVKDWGIPVIINGEQLYLMEQKDILTYL